MSSLSIALAGNPNSGKTTIFNAITGANQKVGNWGGVTVEVKEGKKRFGGVDLALYDLPGTYSLTAYSEEELVARNFILDGGAKVLVDVVDTTNLERNLYLSVQLLETGKPLVFAFNMQDEAVKKGLEIDYDKLSVFFSAPARGTVGRTGKGVDELLWTAIDTAQSGVNPNRFHIDYGPEIEGAIERLVRAIHDSGFDAKNVSPRWFAVKLLERDSAVVKSFETLPASGGIFAILDAASEELTRFFHDDAATVICERRYGFITGALKEAVTEKKTLDRRDLTDRIDRVVLNKWLAYPIFALFMWGIFQLTFKLGAYPMQWIDSGFSALGEWVKRLFAPSMLRDLLTEGIISGIGSVIIFLPNILILFLGLSFLEDTGYMARIAFIMDKLMHRMGLHGKSFIPLVMGIGCTVPAIMAARTLESKKDRILTILVTPLITCSARLPVYVLIAGAFFPKQAGNVIFLIYVVSFVVAFLMGLLFRKTLFRGEDVPFVMELPPYRLPPFRTVVIHMWEKSKH
jgi:ferrous iron transport protein B